MKLKKGEVLTTVAVFLFAILIVFAFVGIASSQERGDERVNETKENRNVTRVKEISRLDLRNKTEIERIRTEDTYEEKGDVSKEYNSTRKELHIRDKRNNNTLIKARLLSGYDRLVEKGEDIRIAELEIFDFEKGREDLFDNMISYDAKRNYKDRRDIFTFKYVINATNITDSENKTYLLPNWEEAIEFTNLSQLPQKHVYIGIYADTTQGDIIEWLPTSDGFNIREWASYAVAFQDIYIHAPSEGVDKNSVVLIDDTHFMVAYTNSSYQGHIKTFSFDENYNITEIDSFEYSSASTGYEADLVKIDDTHFMLAYTGDSDHAYLRTLEINGAYQISSLDVLGHDATQGFYNSLIKIDDTHFMLAYGRSSDGYIKTFSIDGSYIISQLAVINHDSLNGADNSLIKIDDTHFMLAYAGSANDGYIKTFSINGTYYPTELYSLEHDTVNGDENSLVKINDSRYILAYRGSSNDGYIKTFSLNSTYGASQIDVIEHDTAEGASNALVNLSSNNFMLLYKSSSSTGKIKVFSTDDNADNIADVSNGIYRGGELSFSDYNDIVAIDDSHFIVAHESPNDNGAVRIMDINFGDVTDNFNNLTAGAKLDGRATITGGKYWDDLLIEGTDHEFVGEVSGRLYIEDNPVGGNSIATVNASFSENQTVSVGYIKAISGTSFDRSGLVLRSQGDGEAYVALDDAVGGMLIYYRPSGTGRLPDIGTEITNCQARDGTQVTYMEFSVEGNNLTLYWETAGGSKETCTGTSTAITGTGDPGVLVYSRRIYFDNFATSDLTVEEEADTTPPTFSDIAHNNTLNATITKFSVLLADETAVSGYIFGTNNSGSWVNDSFVLTSNWANVTKTLTSTNNTRVGYQWWFNDTSNNLNNTGIQTLLTTAPAPPASDSCTYSGSGQWDILCSDFCNITEDTNVQDNILNISGTGYVQITTGNVTNVNRLEKYSTTALCPFRLFPSQGGSFRLKG